MNKRLMLLKAGVPVTGIFLCMALCTKAYAKDDRAVFPNLTRTGSITVEMRSGESGEVVAGGSLTLYKAADYIWDGNGYIFRYSDEFTGFKEDEYYFDFYELNDEKAEEMAVFAKEQGVEGVTQAIDEEGKVSFPELEAGLYLIAQKEPPEGYYSVNPFFVTVPMLDETLGTYIYNVDASPKTRPYETAIMPEPVPEETESEQTIPEPTIPEPTEAETEQSDAKPETSTPSETEPQETKPEISTPYNASPEESKAEQPTNTTHRRGGGGGGGRTANNSQYESELADMAEISEEPWDLIPLAETGERRDLLIVKAIFILTGILLAVVLWLRFNTKDKPG